MRAGGPLRRRPVTPYTYRVRQIVRVVDGDTVDLRVDLGFHVEITERFRLAGIDTPELVGAERRRGMEAAAWLDATLRAAPPGALWVESERLDSFRRWLGTLWLMEAGGALSVNQALIEAGLAVPYAR